ncbi:MAG: hypothetical protein M0T74_03970 [Desulfitobacterium hafniense]|nr:hypothetical protein [Desulfitobacterium hafniense]
MLDEENSVEHTVDYHLEQALAHVKTAINLSIKEVVQNSHNQKIIGHKWETFLGDFFRYVRDKGKEHRVNMLSWISFPRLRH